MTTSTQPRRICIVEGSDDLRPILTIEVSPHRVSVTAPATIDEVLIWLASISIMPTNGSDECRIFQDDALQIYMHGLTAPYGTITEGSVIFARDELCLDDLVIRIHKGVITLPGGGESFALEHFRYAHAITPATSRRTEGDRDLIFQNRKKSAAIMIELFKSMQIAADDTATMLDLSKAMFERLAAIYARFARVLDLGYPTGAAGASKAYEEFVWLFRKILDTWLLVPDRPYAPRAYRFSDELTQHIQSLADEDLRETVKSALACIGSLDARTLRQAATSSNKRSVGRNNHEQLMTSQVIKRIDSAIEDAAPLDLLKPMARKRQAKRRAMA